MTRALAARPEDDKPLPPEPPLGAGNGRAASKRARARGEAAGAAAAASAEAAAKRAENKENAAGAAPGGAVVCREASRPAAKGSERSELEVLPPRVRTVSGAAWKEVRLGGRLADPLRCLEAVAAAALAASAGCASGSGGGGGGFGGEEPSILSDRSAILGACGLAVRRLRGAWVNPGEAAAAAAEARRLQVLSLPLSLPPPPTLPLPALASLPCPEGAAELCRPFAAASRVIPFFLSFRTAVCAALFFPGGAAPLCPRGSGRVLSTAGDPPRGHSLSPRRPRRCRGGGGARLPPRGGIAGADPCARAAQSSRRAGGL